MRSSKVSTKIVDEIPVKNKATRKSGMFCDHYLFKDTIITNCKVKIAPGQRVEWEHAKEVISCSKIGNREKVFFVYSEFLIIECHIINSPLRVTKNERDKNTM